MAEDALKTISSMLCRMGMGMEEGDVAAWAHENAADDNGLGLVMSLLDAALTQKAGRVAEHLKEKSRIPQANPKTFDNFSTSNRFAAEDMQKLMALRTLSFIPAGKGLVFVGGNWTGKSHLVQAVGNECCEHGYRTLYLTAADLKARMDRAHAKGKEGRLLNTLANYTCLIIDSLEKESYDAMQSKLLYRLLDNKISLCKPRTLILVSAKDLNVLSANFEDKDCFESMMNRIVDYFSCYVMNGKRYSGASKDIVQLKLI